MQKKIIAGVVALCIAVGAIYSVMQMNKEYIGGNVLNLPYKTVDNGEDMMLVIPWITSMLPSHLMYRSLLLPGHDFFFESKPDLATSVDILEDGLLYQVNFIEGNKWSDGIEITLEDVIWSIENVTTVPRANPYYTKAFGLIESMEIDGNKLNIRIKEKSGIVKPFLAQLAILPKHMLGNLSPEELVSTEFWFHPVTSGMYKVEEYKLDTYYKLTHNEYYTGKKPKIETVYLHNGVVSTVKFDYYSTNNISDMMTYRAMRSYQEHPIEMIYYRYIVFNVGGTGDGYFNEFMADKRIRQAICMSFDRDKLLHDVYVGFGNVVNGAGAVNAYGPYRYNPTRAKELIAESGYDLSRPLRFGYYNMDKTTQDFLEAAKKQLEEVGFIVELTPQAGAQKLLVERQYDFYLKGFGATRSAEWFEEYSNHLMTSIMGYKGDFADILAQLNETTDPARYNVLLNEAVAIENDLILKYPLFNLTQSAYINTDRLSVPKGLRIMNFYYLFDYDFANWEIKKQ